MDRNPLRILDCKEQSCQELLDGTGIHAYLCKGCREHLQQVLGYLELTAIPFEVAEHLMRGLDYYTQTVFEILPAGNDQDSLAGGGRYNNLVKSAEDRQYRDGGSFEVWSVYFWLWRARVWNFLREEKHLYSYCRGGPFRNLHREAVRLLLS